MNYEISFEYSAEELAKPLGELSRICNENNMPLISVVVVNVKKK